MKIIFFGNGTGKSNDRSYSDALQRLGLEVYFLDEEGIYQKSLARYGKYPLLRRILGRFAWKFLARSVQKEVLARVRSEKPDGIFIVKGRLLRPSTLRAVKADNPGLRIACFNPDNPFNTWHHGVSNSWIRSSISLYDVYFIWGRFLMEPLVRAGAKKVEYLPFAYDPNRNRPVKASGEELTRFGSDVAFMGSWDEERESWLTPILDYDLKIWGNSWEKASAKVRSKWQRRDVVEDDFAKVCASAKIVLNFVRKQNGQAHNMRTFEVPACGGFLLASRTEEQGEILKEGVEADYFSNPSELRQKLDFYLSHGPERERMAAAGLLAIQPHTFEARAGIIVECMGWR